jgi:hypothetical protein
VIGGGEEVVEKLPGGVRRLGVGSIGRGEDRRGASHGEPGAAAAALGGSVIPVGIGGRLGVREGRDNLLGGSRGQRMAVGGCPR